MCELIVLVFTICSVSCHCHLQLCETWDGIYTETQPVISLYQVNIYLPSRHGYQYFSNHTFITQDTETRETPIRHTCPPTRQKTKTKMHLPNPHVFLLTLSALATTSLASPSYRQLRSLQARSSYTCAGPDPSCQACTAQENQCISMAAFPVYEEVESCIVQAQECYFSAEDADIYGRYGCSDAYTTCVSDGGPGDFCDTQLAACQACETGYDSCRGCPDCVTTEECQESSVTCFMNAVSLNGTVTPRSPGDS